VGYMSPEQVRGEAADQRSDIFSFGSILYEMLTGQRAFKRSTSAETMTAILNEEPPEMAVKTGSVSPALERIVRHCMEKQPARRFQSAHDIAFDLESVSGLSATASSLPAQGSKGKWIWAAGLAAILLAGGLAIGARLVPVKKEASAKLHRITFRRGNVRNARFMPDGNLIYAAAWSAEPPQVFVARAGSMESRALGVKAADILAISKSGEMALLVSRRLFEGFEFGGMLARAPEGGGAPREIEDNVEYADWSPDGSTLATVRRVAGKARLEYPLGKVIYETAGWISHARVSPDGKMVAFLDHPQARDDSGSVAIMGADGSRKIISGKYVSIQGMAWQPDGKEVWFTGTTSGSNRELRAATLQGQDRGVYLGTGTLTLQDIAPDGKVLFTRDDWRSGIAGMAPGASKEVDLSWHDWSQSRDISDDGRLVAFDETGEAGGETGAIYVRGTDGSPAVLLGNGVYATFSADTKWVLAMQPQADGTPVLMKLPIGAGEARKIDTGNVQVHAAYFLPEEKQILELGNMQGDRGLRLWIQNVENGQPKPLTPEGVLFRYRGCISKDGKTVAMLDSERKAVLFPLDGSGAKPIPGAVDGDEPIQWAPDGKHILVGRTELPNRVYNIDLATGQRALYKTFTMADPTGLLDTAPPNFSKDLKSYVFAYTRITSDLYVGEGLR